MKIEKHGNQYRVRKTVDGKKIRLIFDHEPDDMEIFKAFAEHDFSSTKGSFFSCAQSYIASKSNVLSPSTIKGYTSVLNSIPDEFKQKKISEIDQTDIQLVVNEYAAKHTPKSVRNIHGFISAVFRQFRPNMKFYTTLPQKCEYEAYTPSEDDIRMILDYTKDNPFYHIPFQLGIMGLRRSEVCALTLDDIDFDNNILTINKAIVKDVNNKWVIKQTKTMAGTRKIYIPDSLITEIKEYGAVYNGEPTTLLYGLNKIQKKLGIPRFRFHDLRHFFASYAHSQGISDADIMATGGWKSDFTMKSVYRHEMNAKESQRKIFSNLL